MATPSKNFTGIQDGQVDGSSPLDTTLMTQMRDNFEHLKEWLGKNYTAAVDHDHDGLNSKPIVSVADSAITLNKLKQSQGSWSATVDGTWDIYTNASASHLPMARIVTSANAGSRVVDVVSPCYYLNSTPSSDSNYVKQIRVTVSGMTAGDTAYVYWDYHTN